MCDMTVEEKIEMLNKLAGNDVNDKKTYLIYRDDLLEKLRGYAFDAKIPVQVFRNMVMESAKILL